MCVLDRDLPPSSKRERMKSKLRKRQKSQTLLPDWGQEKKFAVTVTVRPSAEQRFLKHFTIAIYQDKSGAGKASPSPRFILE